jgi:predicted permease
MLLRHAVARLLATPLFTLFSIVSLAAGVAVTTAVYSVVENILPEDAGVAEPERVVFVATPVSVRPRAGSISAPDLADLRAAQAAFSSTGASASIQPSVTTTSHAEVLSAEAVDGGYFATLGVGAHLGRVLGPADDQSAARVVVLSDDIWRSRYSSDPAAIGLSIRVNGVRFEIVGIASADYRGAFGPIRTTRLWIPLAAESSLPTTGRRHDADRSEDRRLLVLGRLAPDSTVERASAEVSTIASRLDAAHPMAPGPRRFGPPGRAWSARALGASAEGRSGDRQGRLMIIALAGLVLIVACTNLANLVLARGASRQGELAVRMAMGASRGRLIAEQCVESAILAALGLIASYAAFQGLAALMTAEYSFGIGPVRASLSIRPTLDAPALAVAVAATLLALAVFGLEPAVQLARTVDIRSALARNSSGIRPRLKRQRMVIRWQVAVASGFFILATMFIKGTVQMARHDPGVELNRIAVAAFNFENGAWDEGRIRRTLERVMEDAQRDPSVGSVSASTGLPFGVPPAMQLAIGAAGDTRALTRPPIPALAVTPSIFRTLGIPIVRGRAFTDDDRAGTAPVVVLSELTANRIFGGANAVGQAVALRVGSSDLIAEVVGIARDTDVRFVYADRRPLAYLPLSQHFSPAVTLTARATGDPANTVAALREAIRRTDPDLAVDTIGTGRATLAGPFLLLRSAGNATLYLGGFTLLLSMVGLFGVQSDLVAHRTREIGVRLSFGATANQIKMMVIKDGYRPVLEGLVLGLWGGLAARVVVRSYMQIDVSVLDPWMLLLTPIPLVLAALCASYLPAAQAARVDPAIALRAE